MSAENKIYWALSHGIVMGTGSFHAKKDESEDISVPIVRHAPMAIEPFQFPTASFNKSVVLSPIFNDLVDRIARDEDWLIEKLELTGKNDDFIGQQLNILKLIKSKQVTSWKQSIVLGINRSDYMQHFIEGDARDLLQVEINTIASSFGGLSTKLTEMHKAYAVTKDLANAIPDNSALSGIANGIATSHRMFLSQNNLSDRSADVITIMLVQAAEKNFSDQRLIEFDLLQTHGVTIRRETMANVRAEAHIDESTGFLMMHGKIVSVVYYRCGYT